MARIEFEGNLGAAPELRHTKSGSPVLGFRVADSKSRKLDNGEWEKLAEQWISVSVWGDLGELLANQLDKGVRVRVIGEFYVREYEHNGENKYSLDVRAWGVDVLRRPNGNGFQQQPSQGAQNVANQLGGQAQQGWGAPAQQPAWGTPAADQGEVPF